MTIFMGADIELPFTYAKPDGTLYDPDNPLVTIRAPGDALGAGTDYIPEKESVGLYKVKITVGKGGKWRWRAVGTDPADNRQDVAEGSFEIGFSVVVPEA